MKIFDLIPDCRKCFGLERECFVAHGRLLSAKLSCRRCLEKEKYGSRVKHHCCRDSSEWTYIRVKASCYLAYSCEIVLYEGERFVIELLRHRRRPRANKPFLGSSTKRREGILGGSANFWNSPLDFGRGCGFQILRGVNPFERFLISWTQQLLAGALLTTWLLLVTFDLATSA